MDITILPVIILLLPDSVSPDCVLGKINRRFKVRERPFQGFVGQYCVGLVVGEKQITRLFLA
ncbi:hypothetical protein [Cognatishimia sp. MH4019]|uniref:hypothetical protein n=1 Tax=Cognatishimia sp. MH4019 TaxID=2854030 RepID=UPI001CD7B3EB|nr:hypothetical protein [Cognatishimia sp. MH4019]